MFYEEKSFKQKKEILVIKFEKIIKQIYYENFNATPTFLNFLKRGFFYTFHVTVTP